jgi:hypothetical protein
MFAPSSRKVHSATEHKQALTILQMRKFTTSQNFAKNGSGVFRPLRTPKAPANCRADVPA